MLHYCNRGHNGIHSMSFRDKFAHPNDTFSLQLHMYLLLLSSPCLESRKSRMMRISNVNKYSLPHISSERQHCLGFSYICRQSQFRLPNSSGHSMFAHSILAASPNFEHLQAARQLGTISPVTSSPTLKVLPLKWHLFLSYDEKSGHSKLVPNK